jgi:hypothetical protein
MKSSRSCTFSLPKQLYGVLWDSFSFFIGISIRNELGISPLSENIIEYRNTWKAHLQRMEHTRIPLQAYKYQPSGKRDIDRPRRRWRETQQYLRPEQEILLIHEMMMMVIGIANTLPLRPNFGPLYAFWNFF